MGVCVGGGSFGGRGRGLRNERDRWQHCTTLYYKYPYVSLVPRTFSPPTRKGLGTKLSMCVTLHIYMASFLEGGALDLPPLPIEFFSNTIQVSLPDTLQQLFTLFHKLTRHTFPHGISSAVLQCTSVPESSVGKPQPECCDGPPVTAASPSPPPDHSCSSVSERRERR